MKLVFAFLSLFAGTVALADTSLLGQTVETGKLIPEYRWVNSCSAFEQPPRVNNVWEAGHVSKVYRVLECGFQTYVLLKIDGQYTLVDANDVLVEPIQN